MGPQGRILLVLATDATAHVKKVIRRQETAYTGETCLPGTKTVLVCNNIVPSLTIVTRHVSLSYKDQVCCCSLKCNADEVHPCLHALPPLHMLR